MKKIMKAVVLVMALCLVLTGCQYLPELPEIPGLSQGHTHTLVHNEAKAPTCVNNGILEHWYCPGCNARFADEAATVEVTFADLEVEENGHVPGEDDGDCTTAVMCTVCDKVAVAAKAHTPEADDGDCTTNVMCSQCVKIAIEGKEDHEANEDDGDCTTAVTCKHCDYIFVPAAEAHTPGAEVTCTENQICTVCNTVLVEAPGHIYTDGICVCGLYSVPGALAAADDTQVSVIGTVVKIGTAYSSSYNNISIYIADEEGNQLYLFRMKGNVEVGQIIKVTGTMDTYNGARQIAAGATFEAIGTHTCTNYTEANCSAPATCVVCGATTGEKTEHSYTDGACTVCGLIEGAAVESMEISAAAGTLATDSKSIAWTGTNFTFTNAQDSSTSAIRTSDGDHFRVYAKSKVTISGNDGAKVYSVVITCTSSSYATALETSASSVSGATVTVDGTVVTITLSEPADSISFSASAQWRLNKIEVTYVK